MKKYFGVLAIVMLIGLFFGTEVNAQHRGPHHHPPHREYHHHYHHAHYRHYPPHRGYHHGGGASVRINVPVPRPPRVIVRP